MALSAIFTIGFIRYATVAESNSSRTKSLDKYTITAAKATTKAQMIEGGGIHPAALDPLDNSAVFIDGPSVTGNAFRSHPRFVGCRGLPNGHVVTAIPLRLSPANITSKCLQQITHHLNCQCPLTLHEVFEVTPV